MNATKHQEVVKPRSHGLNREFRENGKICVESQKRLSSVRGPVVQTASISSPLSLLLSWVHLPSYKVPLGPQLPSPRPSVGKAAQNSFEMLTEVVLTFLFVARSALAVSEPDPEPIAHFLANGTWAHPDIAPSYFSGCRT